MSTHLATTGVLLHVGCGRKSIQDTPFAGSGWSELRFDIDSDVQPDVQGSMLNMQGIPDASVNAVFSSHNIEHLEAHQVVQALREFRPVLKPGGFCLITCPDLQSLGAALSADQLLKPLYTSRSGPICALDILYGHSVSLADGHQHMAHRCGFTASSLRHELNKAEFRRVITARRPNHFELWALAAGEELEATKLEPLARTLFTRN